ncbi:MAG: TM2 domain-containing protein [bacterium]|nr:TM2 domain-containing protein [bacterium]
MDNVKLCPFCHNEINVEATRCKHCKKWLDESTRKPKKFLDTLLLSWFLGSYGVHRFYTGYYAIGVIQALTLGGCGIWSLIDFISICFGNYKDANGVELEKYDRKLGLILFGVYLGSILLLILLALVIVIMFMASECTKGCGA